MPRSTTIRSRFNSSYKVADSGCWEWQRGKMSSGYGSLYVGTIDGKDIRDGAHRVSYELHHGPIPSGIFVCHKCDNKACCNPEHLFLGNQEKNMLDAKNKGRLQRSAQSKARTSAAMTSDVRARISTSVSETKTKQREMNAVAAGYPAIYHHCPDCNAWLPLESFYKRVNGNPRSTCKPCYTKSQRKAYKTRRSA